MFGIMTFFTAWYAELMASSMEGPEPVMTSAYPDLPATCQSPSTSLTSPMWTPLRLGFLKRIVASSEYFLNALSSSKGNGGMATTTPTW